MAHPRYAQHGEGPHAPTPSVFTHRHVVRRASRLSAGALLPIPLGPEGQSIHEADRDAEEKDIIFKAKRSVLYFQNVAWVKDEQKKKKKGGENFDVTMYFLDLAFTEMMHLEFLDSQQE